MQEGSEETAKKVNRNYMYSKDCFRRAVIFKAGRSIEEQNDSVLLLYIVKISKFRWMTSTLNLGKMIARGQNFREDSKKQHHKINAWKLSKIISFVLPLQVSKWPF